MSNIIEFRRKPTDQERFDSLVRPHFDALYQAACRITRSPHDAEDLLQEVCIKAFNWLDELEQVEFRRAWLMKVMYNTFIDDARREERSPMGIANTGDDSGDPDELPSDLDSPPELLDRERQLRQVVRAMRCLSADHCALVAMRDIEGLSIRELCLITGMPAGTIKSQLHRIRKKLGRLLSNDAVRKPRLTVVGGRK